LAGAIINVLKRHGEVHLRCFGRRSLWKATKAMIVARTTAASYGTDIYFLPYFIEAVFDGQKQVGFGFTTVANTTPKWGSAE
jgi:stage V sporulation protein SpoVS